MRSLSTIGSLGPEFSNFKPQTTEETRALNKREPLSMPLTETQPLSTETEKV